VVLPQFATKNHAVTLSLPPRWNGEENQKEKGKNSWVGMRTVTEWQRGEENSNQ